jgi:hypothetical protein
LAAFMSAKQGWLVKNKTEKVKSNTLFNETAPVPVTKLIQIVVLNPNKYTIYRGKS